MHTPGEPHRQPAPVSADDAAGRNHAGTERAAYAVTVAVFALLLLVAAGLKADAAFGDLAPVPAAPDPNAGFQKLSVFVEVGVAVWLLSGFHRAWARWAAMALLAVFVTVAGWRLARGEADCGCFGHVRVRPAVTLCFDAVSLLAIGYFGRGIGRGRPGESRTLPASAPAAQLLLALAAGVFVPIATVAVAPHFKSGGVTPVVPGETDPILLTPRDWEGKPFPLLGDVLPGEADLSKGRWVVILVNHACHKCEDYLAKADFDALRRADGPGAPPRTLGLIEFLNDDSEPMKRTGPVAVTTLRLRKGAVYLTDGPYEVYLTDGVVEKTRRG